MKDIRKLNCWNELELLGFEKINFRFRHQVVAVGAALRQEHTSITKEKFHSDFICIEPHNFVHSKECYCIKGKYIEPVPTYLMQYGKKEFAGYSYECYTYVTAGDILKTIKLLKTSSKKNCLIKSICSQQQQSNQDREQDGPS